MQPASNFIALNQHLTQSSFELGGRSKCVLGMGSWACGRKVSVIPTPLWSCVCNTDLQIRTQKFKIFSVWVGIYVVATV